MEHLTRVIATDSLALIIAIFVVTAALLAIAKALEKVAEAIKNGGSK